MNRRLLGDAGQCVPEDIYAAAVAELGAHWSPWESRTLGPQRDVAWSWNTFHRSSRHADLPRLAAAWRERTHGAPVRIRLDPFDDAGADHGEVLSVLASRDVAAGSVSVRWKARADVPSWQWPLRVAAFDDDHAELGLASLADGSELRELATSQRLSRESPCAELLVVRGDLRGVAARVLALPYAVRASVVLALGDAQRTWAGSRALLDVLCAETQAYGAAVTPPSGGGVLPMLRRLCLSLSRGVPFDQALWATVDAPHTLLAIDLRIVDAAAPSGAPSLRAASVLDR